MLLTRNASPAPRRPLHVKEKMHLRCIFFKCKLFSPIVFFLLRFISE